MKSAGITSGSLFRRVSSAGRVWGERVTEKLVWHVVKEFAAKIGVSKLAPHDLRRYAESRTMPNRCEEGSFGVELVTNAVNLFGIVRRESEAIQESQQVIVG
jgi:hypothetical protein